ncbi:hypothetical protein B0H13DRAFT_1918841 [Mycena leptocephala]|nr:hypothetical protein B0H13DRAFT_1918841 [Mycena leptocephala]
MWKLPWLTLHKGIWAKFAKKKHQKPRFEQIWTSQITPASIEVALSTIHMQITRSTRDRALVEGYEFLFHTSGIHPAQSIPELPALQNCEHSIRSPTAVDPTVLTSVPQCLHFRFQRRSGGWGTSEEFSTATRSHQGSRLFNLTVLCDFGGPEHRFGGFRTVVAPPDPFGHLSESQYPGYEWIVADCHPANPELLSSRCLQSLIGTKPPIAPNGAIFSLHK